MKRREIAVLGVTVMARPIRLAAQHTRKARLGILFRVMAEDEMTALPLLKPVGQQGKPGVAADTDPAAHRPW